MQPGSLVAYKINTAFYEALGVKGWEAMEKTVRYIGDEHFTIADAKRGDIGNTSDQYAKAFFEMLPFDSITVAPYMGRDSVKAPPVQRQMGNRTWLNLQRRKQWFSETGIVWCRQDE